MIFFIWVDLLHRKIFSFRGILSMSVFIRPGYQPSAKPPDELLWVILRFLSSLTGQQPALPNIAIWVTGYWAPPPRRGDNPPRGQGGRRRKWSIGCPQLRWRDQHTLQEDGTDHVWPNPWRWWWKIFSIKNVRTRLSIYNVTFLFKFMLNRIHGVNSSVPLLHGWMDVTMWYYQPHIWNPLLQ
jgi:hypothetical protein